MAFNNAATETPRLAVVSGETTELCMGVSTASGSALTVTCPQLSTVIGVVTTCLVSGATATVTATATNTFTVATTNAADEFSWIAWGTARM